MKRLALVLLAACAEEPGGGGPHLNSTVDTYSVWPSYPPVIDVLVVLDHTTAMAPYQSGLAAFATSIVALANNEIMFDLRVAVTTADATGALRDPAMSSDGFLALGYDVHFERQPNFTGALSDAVTQLVEAPRTLAEMGAAARRLGRPDAAARVADLLVKGSGGARA